MDTAVALKKTMQVLDWCYDKSIDGFPPIPSASELAENYLTKHHQNTESAINDFIHWQHVKAGTSGFLTGVGGALTLPLTLVSIPADLTAVIYIQLRMIAVIAYLRNYDLHDDEVRTFAYVCLVGRAGIDMLSGAGIKVGEKVAVNVIKKIPAKVLTSINQKVGGRIVTKFGQNGVVNLVKLVPLVGGAVGGTIDVGSNIVIAQTAKKVFVRLDNPNA
ncbi:EcsC family protein [Sporolactobacillus sp. KGMB 08714]|uniref:EcsC family protein n=1 Tax=Sporolactobacillus sp. KGMB 08714 TaxID=3064704 RepID=UPI002FBE8D90